MMPTSPATRALTTMRNLAAQGWAEESLMVDGAADVLIASGMARADAQAVAQAVFDRHFKIMGGA